MENLIYWHGIAIGYENGWRNIWFPSAPKEAIAAIQMEQASTLALAPTNTENL